MGKGKKPGEDEERIARPISTLKDPAAFGPPRKFSAHFYISIIFAK